ncbi:MAG: hypothetical protein PVH89_04880 [Gammaproteobacteria bacterium]|jgi:hypothetical protein
MTTTLDDLWPGCRAIEAQYRPNRETVRTLEYTVWVQPVWSTISEYDH